MIKDPLLILLADDDEDDRILFTEAFSELKIKTNVYTVNDGIQLMEWLNNNENPMPHFLFLDLNMPRKNGMECLKEIRSNERLKEIFLAIYSTSDNQKDMDETFMNGANVYITKPSGFKELKALLQKAVAATLVYEASKTDRKNFILKI
jgi:CheY-like chemotaxis protein